MNLKQRSCVAFCVLACIVVVYLSGSQLSFDNGDLSSAHHAFMRSFKRFGFVPKMFRPSKKTNFWANAIVVDKKSKYAICIPAGTTKSRWSELLIRTMTNCHLPPSNYSTYTMRMFNCYTQLPLYESSYAGIWNDRSWKKIAITVDPLERFLSSFTTVCTLRLQQDSNKDEASCFHCGADIACFVDKLHELYTTFLTQNMFSIFSTSIYNFLPQFWSCGYARFLKNFDVAPESSRGNLTFETFAKVKLKETPIPYNGWGTYQNETLFEIPLVRKLYANHRSWDAPFNDLINHPDVLKKLLTVYAIDYVSFNHRLPDWVLQACPDCRQTVLDAVDEYGKAAVRHKSEL